jgi:hypothetical protein
LNSEWTTLGRYPEWIRAERKAYLIGRLRDSNNALCSTMQAIVYRLVQRLRETADFRPSRQLWQACDHVDKVARQAEARR